MQLPKDFHIIGYINHLTLYKQRNNTDKSGLFNKELVRIYGQKLIDDGLLTEAQYSDNLLPEVDFADLLGLKGSICDDGQE
jgi:hypothetical protein